MSDQPQTSTGPDLTAGSAAGFFARRRCSVPGPRPGRARHPGSTGRGDLRDRRDVRPLRGPLAEGLVVDDTVRCRHRLKGDLRY